MLLSDTVLAKEMEMGRLLIEPFEEDMLQPASIDITLGDDFMTALPGATEPVIKPMSTLVDNALHFERVVADGAPHPAEFNLYPNQLVLATSMEFVEIPNDIAGQIIGKTSLARIGVSVCQTSGFIQPGFKGKLTLELLNLTNRPIELVPKMKIAQIVFYRLEEPATCLYGSPKHHHHYQGTTETAAADFSRLEDLR